MNAVQKNPSGVRDRAGDKNGQRKSCRNYSTGKINFNENPIPCSKPAESGCLSACIADSMKLDPVQAIAGPDDFYMGGAKAVFTKMLELHSKDSDLTGSPFLTRLEQSFECHEDYSKFQDLFETLRPITGTTALHFARIVREMADRREIIRLTYEANMKAFDTAFDLNDIIEELLEPLSRLEEVYS